MAERLFRVADVFVLRKAGRIVVATDCPTDSAPQVKIGELLEFRNPDGSVFRTAITGIELCDPYDPDRPFGFPISADSPEGAVQVGAEVWAVRDTPA